MARKTLTVSKESYDALARLKTRNESFSDVILRLSKKTEVGKLSEYMETMKPDEDLANEIENFSKDFRSSRLHKIRIQENDRKKAIRELNNELLDLKPGFDSTRSVRKSRQIR